MKTNPDNRRICTVAALLIIALMLGATPREVAAQGLLSALTDRVRTDVPTIGASSPASPKSKRDKHQDHHHHSQFGDDDEDDDDTLSLWALGGMVVGGAITSPFWGPPVVLGDDYGRPGHFPRYPYEDELNGFMMIDPWVPSAPYPWATRLSVEYADTFDDLTNLSGKLLFDTTTRLGLDSEVNHRTERVTSSFTDELWTGDVNIVFRLAQTERVQIRSGLGVNWLLDDVDDSFGFNFTYGLDFFPKKPWVVSAELDWGRLGDAHLIHLRSTVGMQYKGAELFVGYDYYDVGSAEIGALVSGLRIWF